MSHEERMGALKAELKARRALLAELEEQRKEKEKVTKSMESKKRALADMEDVLEAASSQASMDLYPWIPRAVIDPVIKQLPVPLKTLYHCLLDVRDEERVEVILRQRPASARKRAKRARTEQQGTQQQPAPVINLQLFKGGDQQCLSIEFSYSASKGIVVAKCPDTAGTIVLAALFPRDTGGDKGYRWVQDLASIGEAGRAKLSPQAVVERLFECEACLRSLGSQLDWLKNRHAPLSIAEDLFLVTQPEAKITSFSEVLPGKDAKKTGRGVINLVSDGEEEGELKEDTAEAESSPASVQDADRWGARQLHRIFKVILQKGDLELEARICVFITYPDPPPLVDVVALRQLATSHSGGRQHVLGHAELCDTNATNFMGQQANIAILEALDPKRRTMALSCQVHMLMVAFDDFAKLYQATTTVKKGTTRQVDLFNLKATIRGRDRRFNRGMRLKNTTEKCDS
eukprot:evm.model.scf_292.4 EVM.evm.TU.scf_292.4   scf_292:25208-34158(-)